MLDTETNGYRPTRWERRAAKRAARRLTRADDLRVTERQSRSNARPLDTPGAKRSREARRRIRQARKANRP